MGRAHCCAQHSERQWRLGLLLGSLATCGILLCLVPWLEADHAGAHRRHKHVLSTRDLHRHSLWLSPPACCWALWAAVCMLRGSTGTKRSWWLGTSFEICLVVAPISIMCCSMLGWQAMRHRHGHAAYHHAHAEHAPHSGGRLPAVYTYGALSLVMLIQAAVCASSALLLRGSARSGLLGRGSDPRAERIDDAEAGRGGYHSDRRGGGYHSDRRGTIGRTTPHSRHGAEPPGSASRERLSRGWVRHVASDGQPFYEHAKTGRVQWEPPERHASSHPSRSGSECPSDWQSELSESDRDASFSRKR